MAKPNSSNRQISLVFFGAGPVASESLEFLIQTFQVEAVITKPRSKGNTAPVIDLANMHNLPIFTPLNRLELSEIIKNNRFSSQIGLVIDFGIIISSDVIDSFSLGIINSHFSLLPEWRGADPITFSLLSGQARTGVSLMQIVEALDEGPLIAQGELNILPTHTNQSLTKDLIDLSNTLLAHYLPMYVSGEISPGPQDLIAKSTSREVSYSRKLSKNDGLLDWNKDAETLEREIRAYQGWPQSRCKLGRVDLIITEASVVDKKLKPGEYQVDNKQLIIGCKSKSLQIKRLKPIGKNEMDISSFLAGYLDKL